MINASNCPSAHDHLLCPHSLVCRIRRPLVPLPLPTTPQSALAALVVRRCSPRICPRRAPPAATLKAAQIFPLRARGAGRRSCCHPTRRRWTIRCRRAVSPAVHAQPRPHRCPPPQPPLRSHCHRPPPRHWRLRCLSWTLTSRRRQRALLPLLLLPTPRLSLRLHCSWDFSTVRTTRKWATWMSMRLRLRPLNWPRSIPSRPCLPLLLRCRRLASMLSISQTNRKDRSTRVPWLRGASSTSRTPLPRARMRAHLHLPLRFPFHLPCLCARGPPLPCCR